MDETAIREISEPPSEHRASGSARFCDNCRHRAAVVTASAIFAGSMDQRPSTPSRLTRSSQLSI